MNKRLLILGIALILLAVPMVRAENIDDQSPFWTKLFSNVFSVNFYDPSNPADVACAKQWNCIYNPDIQKTRIDCYSSGTSSSGCLCEYTASSTLLAANGCSSTPTSTTSGSCSLGSGGTLSSGSSKCIGTIKMTCTNGVLSSKSDPSCGTVVYDTTTGAVSTTTTTGCAYNNPSCPSGQVCVASTGTNYAYSTQYASNAGYQVSTTSAGTCMKLKNECTPGGNDKCDGTKPQVCTTDALGGNAWRTFPSDCAPNSCFISNDGKSFCGTAEQAAQVNKQITTTTTKCIKEGQVNYPGGLDCCSGLRSGLDTLEKCRPTTQHRDITDAEIKNLNDKAYTPDDGKLRLHDTSCSGESDCINKVCKTFDGVGLDGVGLEFNYPTIPLVKYVCYSGTTPPTPPSDCIKEDEKLSTGKECCAGLTDVDGVCKKEANLPTEAQTKTQASYTFKEWQNLAPAIRIKSACSVDENCAPYEDLEGTGKDYSVKCKQTQVIVDQLTEDSKNVCQRSWIKKVGNGVTWLGASGCIGAIALTGACAAVTGGICTVAAPITIGVCAGTASIATATLTGCAVFNQPDLSKGACIAVPKGGAGTFAWLTEEHDIFGFSVPTWGIVAGVIVLLMILPTLLGGVKK